MKNKIKKKEDYIKVLNKLAEMRENNKEKCKFLICDAFTTMIEARTEEMEKILGLYVDKDEPERKELNINYNMSGLSKFNTQKLRKILELFDEDVIIQTGNNMPITLIDDNWKVVFAPKCM